MPLILGIETSCDETAAAVVQDGCLVRSNVIATQHHLHEKYGGVVPEIASRAHLERLLPVFHEALALAGVGLRDLHAVAVGNRPGLIGSLLVGVSAAKALAWSLDAPLIGVDHVQAHLYAALLEKDPGPRAAGRAAAVAAQPGARADLFPALGLVVSGGHTSLYEMRSSLELRLVGRTIDDAVGEAYDKAAVILDLGYPGGPRLDQLAQTAGAEAPPIDLPRSLLARDSLDFSFSGLKTALLYKVRGLPQGRGDHATFARSAADLSQQDRVALAGAFQHAAIATLIAKVERALDQMQAAGRPARALLVGGGVSANSLLRRRAQQLGRQRGLFVGLPAMEFCLDNAAMIAGLAHEHLRAGRVDDLFLPAVATAAM